MAASQVQKLIKHLPEELKTRIGLLSSETIDLFDTLLRFSLGLQCPSESISDDTKQIWSQRQQEALTDLRGSTAEKRSREDVAGEQNGEEPMSKRAKVADTDTDDEHIFTLHALSVSSPIRKKVDVALYQKSLRLLNTSSHAPEFVLPLSDLRRAFLIPTRGKTKPHWTVILISSDSQTPSAGKQKGKTQNGSGAADQSQAQIVFGVDAVPMAAYVTSEASHPKGTPILPSLRAFLSHLPPHVFAVDLSLEEGAKVRGIQAYRRAKEGTLWFLGEGVLWDGKPCEFWDVADLVGSHPEEDTGTGTGTDGVRIVSATGRTCSVFLSRQITSLAEKEDEDEDEGGEVEVEETDFGMIDGKEQDGILQWVKRHRRFFGQKKEVQPEDNGTREEGPSASKPDVKGKGKAVAPLDEDEDDEEDDDFVGESDSDDGSPTESSVSGSEDGQGEGSQSGGEDAEMDDEESEDGEEEELDPARHPLMRPGAMPKLSRAAMEAAVGMVTEDLLGGSKSVSVGDDDDEDDEEDELED